MTDEFESSLLPQLVLPSDDSCDLACSSLYDIWVVVKPGNLERSYFVESSSGVLYPVREDNCRSPHISIQSKWDNNSCCWVKAGGEVGSTDPFVHSDGQKLLPRDITAWNKNPVISKETFVCRYLPNGSRTLNVDKATMQLFSGEAVDPKQRVVTRMIEYTDNDKLIVEKVTEIFSDDRTDGLISRIRAPLEMSYLETFSTKNSIRERKVVDGEFICVKWHRKARMDGMIERVEDTKESTITENFLDRKDYLEKRVIKFTPGGSMDLASIEEITEQFKRPTDELELDQTVASRVHSLKEERIVATPHAEHEVLRQSHTYTGATDEHVKAEATISEIERIQWEMADLFESIYQHEIPASGE